MAPIGIDTGGTFTDFIWLDGDGRLRVRKEPSTPDDPSRAIVEGLETVALSPDTAVVHGSTVATNALLQRRGARTALITTAGFADVLEIGRQNRPDLYALVPQKPPPLVPREWRREVTERVSAQGEVITSLDPAALVPLLERLADGEIESVAVCLLFSFLYPEHERLIARAIDDYAGRTGWRPQVSLSSNILPEYREFERTAATVINAYVGPLMSRYLARLAADLAPHRLSIMQSNGGLISAGVAGAKAVRTVLSGPASGVVGARFVAAMAGKAAGADGDFDAIITFDMGGTSTDVALCPGRLPTTTEGEIAGLPLRIPIIDIHTVGAGGGSLAYVDAGGALHAGPESAGARPGPACYHAQYTVAPEMLDQRRPETESTQRRKTAKPQREVLRGVSAPLRPGVEFFQPRATVTDANLVLGRLDARHFLGGEMALYEGPAREALSELAADMKAGSPEAAAAAVIRVANATMERAIRRISVERGHDPRRFTLVAFGGGGPLHACELAEALRVPRILVPTTPGVLSALGMLAAAPTRDYSRTVLWALGRDDDGLAQRLAACFAPLVESARADMAAEGYDDATLALRLSLDMRYLGQSHELAVSAGEWAGMDNGPQTTDHDAGFGAVRGLSSVVLLDRFHAAHAARYGYARPEAPVEIVTLRLAAVAPAAPPAWPEEAYGSADPSAAFLGSKAVWFGEGFRPAALYDRERLRPGNRVDGPAIIFQYDTTTLLTPGWRGAVDAYRNLILTRS